MIDAYGGACVCCGEVETAFLCIDHIQNDGARHREQIGQGVRQIGSGSVMMAWLVQQGFPSGFQLLCANCNQAKASVGVCPHVGVAQLVERDVANVKAAGSFPVTHSMEM